MHIQNKGTIIIKIGNEKNTIIFNGNYWTEKGINIPLTGQIVFFKKASHLEIGIGGQYIYDFAGNMTMLSHLLNIGYRYQNFNGKFIFRIGFEKNHWLAYPYISFRTVF